ncbi:MAG: hypothetical protein P4L84_21940 [Isosphaeraceae bacterium]|nr:hypothetical protein [Isosphaeraceae bacterium]
MPSESPPAKKARSKAVAKPKPLADPETTSFALRLADWGLIACFLALTFLLGVFPLKDTDFWWHLRTGDLIRQTGQVPTTDLYTYTVPNAPWFDLHWGFQVAISWIYAHWGVPGLNLAKCAVTCAAVLLLVTARRRDWPVWVMLIAWLPALLLLGGRMYVRPETLSLLYLSVFLAVLCRWQHRPWLALVLPVVELLWVNSHGLFVLGPIVLTFALVDAALRPGAFAQGRSRWWRIAATACALTFLACLVNPYGILGALYPLQLAQTMRNPIFSELIAELTPIPLFIKRTGGLHNLPLQIHLATMFLGGLSFLVPLAWAAWVRMHPGPEPAVAQDVGSEPKPRKARKSKSAPTPPTPVEPAVGLSPLRLLLFGAFSYLSWQATRNSHQFAAVVGTVTAWNFGEWAAAIRRRNWQERQTPARFAAAYRLLAFGAIAVVFALVASGQFYGWTREGRTIGLGEEALWYPHAAAQFAGRPDMPTRLLTYHIGHASLYEYYHGPKRKVFADARLEVIGPDLFQRYNELHRRILTNDPNWDRALGDGERPAILVGHNEEAVLAGALLGSSHWRCVWFDPVASIYVHDSYPKAVQAYEVDFGARHFRPSGDTDPQGNPALLAAAKALSKCVAQLQERQLAGRARPLVWLGLDYARRIEQADPRGLDGWKVQGQIELSRGALSPTARYRLPYNPVFDLSVFRATYAFRRALEVSPHDFLTLLELGEIVFNRTRGMGEEALPLLDDLVNVPPLNSQQAQTQAGIASDRAALVEQLGPEPPRTWANLSELDRTIKALLDRGRVRSAADFLERAYPTDPRPWDVADRLALLRLHLGEPARARALWARSVEPPTPALRTARVALTHLIEGNFDAARAAYHEAIAADAGLFEAHFGLAALEQDDARAGEALSAARRAAATAPDNVARDASLTIADDVAPYVRITRQAPAAAP